LHSALTANSWLQAPSEEMAAHRCHCIGVQVELLRCSSKQTVPGPAPEAHAWLDGRKGFSVSFSVRGRFIALRRETFLLKLRWGFFGSKGSDSANSSCLCLFS
jgi:hypothetical protein